MMSFISRVIRAFLSFTNPSSPSLLGTLLTPEVIQFISERSKKFLTVLLYCAFGLSLAIFGTFQIGIFAIDYLKSNFVSNVDFRLLVGLVFALAGLGFIVFQMSRRENTMDILRHLAPQPPTPRPSANNLEELLAGMAYDFAKNMNEKYKAQTAASSSAESRPDSSDDAQMPQQKKTSENSEVRNFTPQNPHDIV